MEAQLKPGSESLPHRLCGSHNQHIISVTYNSKQPERWERNQIPIVKSDFQILDPSNGGLENKKASPKAVCSIFHILQYFGYK